MLVLQKLLLLVGPVPNIYDTKYQRPFESCHGNHAHFSCLKPARREHRLDNYTRHQKCTKRENGKEYILITCCFTRLLQLKLVQHPCPVYMMLFAGDNSPDFDQNGLQKQGSILLASGGQISLIREVPAAMLGLKGKYTSITT